MSRKKGITIYDIASELNLSASTVSRSLQDHYSISKKTKEAVRKLAKERGYQPNSLAASLRSNKTNTIGVIVPQINRPFISSLIHGIEISANEAGYNVIISQSHDDYETEVANTDALYGSRVCGLVVSLGMKTKKYDHFRQFIKHNIPLVLVDRVTKKLNSDCIIIDNAAAGFEATSHLIKQGCKNIAHVAGAQHRNTYRERLNGYIAALKSHDLPINEEMILHNDLLNADDGIRCAKELLNRDNPPDGIFCANDTTAVRVIQYANRHGIKVPDELAVIGFNNDPQSEIIDPPLSTIEHPGVDMGRIAVQQVLKSKGHSDIVRSESVVLNTKLIVRGSSKREGF